MDTQTKIDLIAGIAVTIGIVALGCYAYLGIIELSLIDPWVMP